MNVDDAARVAAEDLGAQDLHVTREDDEIHRKYVQRFYNKQWDDTENYDLVIDRHTVSADEAVRRIVEAARAPRARARSDATATVDQIQVETVLADAVAQAMANLPPRLPS